MSWGSFFVCTSVRVCLGGMSGVRYMSLCCPVTPDDATLSHFPAASRRARDKARARGTVTALSPLTCSMKRRA
eukprot:436811-Pyramimonas_sp.AAC.1